MSDNTEFATNMLPVPKSVELSGDILAITTGLYKKPGAIKYSTLLSVIGKGCMKIFQSLPLSETENKLLYLYFISI